jgi:3-dehydroquinate dehydratase/shikimate dehydrogenase
MNRICLSLTGNTISRNKTLLDDCRPLVQLAEIRTDFLDERELAALGRAPQTLGVPLILTCRRARDGGRYTGSDRERLGLLSRALNDAAAWGRPFAFVDVEEDLQARDVETLARSTGGRVIRSIHDPRGVPTDLANRLTGMRHHRSDLPKAAVTPCSTADLTGLFRTARGEKGEKILIGMGDYGFPTRVLTARMGSYLTFASAPQTHSAAPGHIDPQTLTSLYRYQRVTAGTRVFGVIGNPVMHSFSPAIHNRGYRMTGLDAVYLPFLVDDVAQFFELADELAINGVSVTIPHKQAVIRFLAERSSSVATVGACNTLVRRDELWYGTNTDVPGFLSPLSESGGMEGRNPGRATIVGAGGASRAVIHALVGQGWDLLILNRTAEKAADLGREFGCEHGALDRRGLDRVAGFRDLIVQTTSLGMIPWETEDPLAGYEFDGSEVVYDLVFNPPETIMLARARSAGCITIRGGRMLVAQALHQFKLFTGEDYPEPETVDIGG